jgi:transposase-like protein
LTLFEEDTVDISCPKCGHKNSLLVHEFEEHTEVHFVCEGCHAGVKVEAEEFHRRLEEVQKELEELEHDAAASTKQKPKRGRKDDFQI